MASRTRHPYPIRVIAPMETLGPILAVGSTSAVSSMKQGSMISGPFFGDAAAGVGVRRVAARRRRRPGLVVLYAERMRALAGTAELFVAVGQPLRRIRPSAAHPPVLICRQNEGVS
jgi:hypothetical protein